MILIEIIQLGLSFSHIMSLCQTWISMICQHAHDLLYISIIKHSFPKKYASVITRTEDKVRLTEVEGKNREINYFR